MKTKILKKTYLLCMALALATKCLAQTPIPVTGDTIYGRDSTHYHYEWWTEDWLSNPDNRLDLNFLTYDATYFSLYADIYGEILQRHTVKSTQVVGLAAAMISFANHGYGGTSPDYPFVLGEPDSAEYLLLYDCIRDSFPQIKKIPWHFNDPHRYMHLDIRGKTNTCFITECCDEVPSDTEAVIPVYEYYFDEPVTLADSFYVGHTQNSRVNPYASTNNNFRAFAQTLGFVGYCYRTFPGCTALPPQKYKIKGESAGLLDLLPSDSLWYWRDITSYMLVFPILTYDTVAPPPPYQCPTVTNLRTGDFANGCMPLRWDPDGEHQSWQVSWGPAGTLPDDGTLANCPYSVTTLCNLDTATLYVAYVRGICLHDGETLYGDWSDSVTFTVPSSSTEGIALADEVSIRLVPNPATNRVDIFASSPIERIEVFDMKGARVHSSAHDGHSVTLDIGNWASGNYIVLVHTPMGSFNEKLVVN